MKTTFTNYRNAKVEIEIYSECKYTASKEVFDNSKKVQYEGVTDWSIVSGIDAIEEVELFTDNSSIDDMHEYLILHFEDGSEATFRNSYVDMFII